MDIKRSKLKEEQEFIHKLSKGIDPTTGLLFDEDTILNNKDIKNALRAIEKTYSQFIEYKRIDSRIGNKYHLKEAFALTKDEISLLSPEERRMTVSEVAYRINSVSKRDGMRKFRANSITEWLEEKGYLVSVSDENGNYRKTPTEDGKRIGIIPVDRMNSIGKVYSANQYTKEAQEFIYEHIDDILE